MTSRPDRLRHLAAAAVAAATAAAPAPASGGGLTLTADPPRLLLGGGGVAALRLSAGVEPPGEVVFAASLGTVEDVQRVPGGFTARYRAPAGLAAPAVAIVAAVAWRGGLDGALAIPLDGQGIAQVRASPGEPVDLRIGDRTFGPVAAGPDGVARLHVVVPPGVAEGYRGFRPVELVVPQGPRLLAVADRAAVVSDRPERVRVLAWVVAPHGAPRAGDAPSAVASRGRVAVAARAPGAYEVTWTLPPGPPGEELLRLAVGEAPPWELRVRAEPGLAAPGEVVASLPALAPAPPRAPAGAVLASAGVAVDLGGAFAVPRAALSVDAAPVAALRGVRWRVEAELLGAPPRGLDAAAPDTTVAALGGAVLAGASVTRAAPGGALRFASATAGVRLAGTRAGSGTVALTPGPALRLAAGLARRLSWGTPFVEAGLTATGGAAVGGRLAFTLSLGLRGEGRHDGEDPGGR